MDFKNLVLALVILVLTSSYFIKRENSMDSEASLVFYTRHNLPDSGEISRFESNDFVSRALYNYSIANLNRNYLNVLMCSKLTVVNEHDSTVTDTIYTYSDSKNKIQIYRAKQNDFVFTFDVTNPQFMLAGNIKPGMTKDEFYHKFRSSTHPNNIVEITDSEENMFFMFYFENNLLSRINSSLYLD